MNSIVIPVYKNETSLPDLFAALENIAARSQRPLEVVFAVDGSPDRCADIIREKQGSLSFSSQLVVLSRNFGSFAAIRAGLKIASGKHITVMAADLQEPPEMALEFFEALEKDEADIILGTRRSRQDPFLTKVFSKTFWSLYRRFIQPDVPVNGVDVFGCNQVFRDALISLNESNSSLIGQIFWLGFRRKFVQYDRLERAHGKSAWTFRKKLKYFYDNFFSFSDLPIRLILWAGGIGMFSSLIFGLVVVINRIFGLISVPGYTATVLAILFFAGLNSFGLGIIGTYVYRAFENTKNRPDYVVLKTQSSGKKIGL